MSYASNTILTDLNGKPIPQYFNVTTDKFEPALGNDGGLAVSITGSKDVTVSELPPLPVGSNLIGQVKLTDGTDVMLVNSNGSITVVNRQPDGTECFTASFPGFVAITSLPEVEVKNDSGNPLAVSVTGLNDVDVLSLPPLPPGTNSIGSVVVSSIPEVEIKNDSGTPLYTQLPNKVRDYIQTSGVTTRTYNTPMYSVLLMNDGATDMTLTVSGLTMTIKAGEVLDEAFPQFTSVTTTAANTFRMWVRGA